MTNPTWPRIWVEGSRQPIPLDRVAILLGGGASRSLDVEECKCTTDHRPDVLEPQRHHLWPKYLGGPEHPDTLLLLCPTTHTNAHRILRAMVKADRFLLRNQGEPRYSYTVASAGFQAWSAAGKPKILDHP